MRRKVKVISICSTCVIAEYFAEALQVVQVCLQHFYFILCHMCRCNFLAEARVCAVLCSYSGINSHGIAVGYQNSRIYFTDLVRSLLQYDQLSLYYAVHVKSCQLHMIQSLNHRRFSALDLQLLLTDCVANVVCNLSSPSICPFGCLFVVSNCIGHDHTEMGLKLTVISQVKSLGQCVLHCAVGVCWWGWLIHGLGWV